MIKLLPRAALKLIRFIYFPDEFIIYSDVAVRMIFTLYYLPVMAVVVALTHSVLQAMVHARIVPLSRELQFEHAIDKENLGALTAFVYELLSQMIPFATLGVAVVALGHKAINGVGEAMVDCFSKIDDKDYPLLAARFQFVVQKEGRFKIFLASIVFLFAIFGVAFYSNVLFVWSSRDPQVLLASWTIIASQAAFILYTSTSAYSLECSNSSLEVKRSFLDYFLKEWWQSTIHRIRHLSMEMVLCCGVFWFLSKGAVDSLSMCVEVLLYLNMPHLFGFIVLSFSVSMARAFQSFFWLGRHRHEHLTVWILVLPQQVAILFSLDFFEYHVVAQILYAALSLLLWSRGIQLLREYDTFGYGFSVLWREQVTQSPIALHIAAVLEDAFERQHPVPSMVSLDLSLDLVNMTMTRRNASPVVIERIPQVPLARSAVRSWRFFLYALPRLVTMQSGASYGGRRFRNVRVFLRSCTMTLLLVFIFIVAGVVIQAAFPQLRPLPVRVEELDNGNLVIDHFIVKLEVSSSDAARSDSARSTRDAYGPLCTQSFSGVSIWELSWLSTASYVVDRASLERMLSFLRRKMDFDWEAVFATGMSTSSLRRVMWDGFLEFRSKKHNISVIAIRGTDLTSFADALQDVNMFFEVALYHTLSSVVPGASLLPNSLIADFIKLGSGVDSISRQHSWDFMSTTSPEGSDADPAPLPWNGRDYYSGVREYIEIVSSLEQAADSSHSQPRLLVGHSLGGAVGHLVGSKLGLRSIGFSSPGLMLSHKKFGIDTTSIHQLSTTIVSSHDIVPTIGGQGGELFHVECVADRRELCHAMEFMVGTLWHSCGSIQKSYPHIVNVVAR